MTVGWAAGFVAGGMAALLWMAAWRQDRSAGEIVGTLGAWMALSALTFWLYAPYLGGGLVGAGDAYHYTLQIADFVTQLRRGHFPIFVGQSAYAFNGNIHTLRTAPYFLHFVGGLDLATWHRLSFPALLDLTIVCHALGLAMTAWLTARWLVGRAGAGWAAGFAGLYLLAPAIAETVQAFDLVATYMALPWLPILVWAMVAVVEEGNPCPGVMVGTGVLAIIWWAHPALAAWATIIWGVIGLAALFRRRGDPGAWLAAAAGVAGLGVLTAYCFVSVHSLDLNATFGTADAIRAGAVRTVQALWPRFIFPSATAPRLDLSPGCALWLAAIVSAVLWRGRSFALNSLVACVLILLLFLGAVPFATTALWARLPDSLVHITYSWPVQRLAPLLAALLLGIGALGLRQISRQPVWVRQAAGLLLLFLVGWSIRAAIPGRRQAINSRWEATDASRALDPRNVYLTRSSYAMFGRLPDTFTNGRTSALWEMRLLQTAVGPSIASNAGAVVAAAQNRGEKPAALGVGVGPGLDLPIQPDRGYVLEFLFSQPPAAGEIKLEAGSISRTYSLPSSGESAAFGSAPGNAYLVGFEVAELEGPTLHVAASIAGVSVRAYPFDPASLPFQLESLLPLRARVEANTDAWLETPRGWMPGYAAQVDHHPVTVKRSPNGFATLPVPRGVHEIELDYRAPALLRTTYFLSLGGFAGWIIALPAVFRPRRKGAVSTPTPSQSGSIRRLAGVLTLLALLAGTALLGRHLFGGPGSLAEPPARGPTSAPLLPGAGPVRLTLLLPQTATQAAEPLLLTGTAGAADLVYLRYLPGRRLQIGFDHWSVGGPISPVIDYTPGERQVVEVEHSGLLAEKALTATAGGRAVLSPIVVRWNGRIVLDFKGPVYPGATGDCVVGQNTVGASSASPRFTGTILDVVRLAPP